jgi:citrate lyase subunit beta/citryl-CoA lyase
VAWANESFSPSPAEVERARRLVDAFEKATAEGHGAISFEGQMVDEPLARRARAVIAGAEA